MKKVLILFSVTLILVFVSVACEAGKKGTNIEGKVVDKDGKPISGVKVVATQKEPLKGYEKFETKTKGDGSFVFKGLYPESVYELSPVGEHCSRNKTEIITGPIGETKMVKEHIVAGTYLFNISKDGVIFDPRTGLEWGRAPKEEMTWAEASRYVQKLSLAGGGWRLPTRAELRGLYETGEIGCGIGDDITGGTWVWSSELDEFSHAWGFDLDNGKEGRFFYDHPNFKGSALAVRSRR